MLEAREVLLRKKLNQKKHYRRFSWFAFLKSEFEPIKTSAKEAKKTLTDKGENYTN